MRITAALIVLALALTGCRDENRACCAKIVPPHELAQEESSSASAESSNAP